MRLLSSASEYDIRRLQPQYNADPKDRAHAWNEWLQRGGVEPVLKYIRWANGTQTDDDEILQETLIIAYLKVERGQYEDRSIPFTAFLKKIAHFKIMEASRRGSRLIPLDAIIDYAGEDTAEHDEAELWREQEVLQAALAHLPARRRQVMMLYEIGYSTAEIAERLGIREELVRKEKSLGIRQLRESLSLAIAS